MITIIIASEYLFYCAVCWVSLSGRLWRFVDLLRCKKMEYLIVEFVDDDVNKQGESIPTAIINSNWTFYDDEGELLSYWPEYITTQHGLVLTLKEDFEIDKNRCSVYRIKVKYRTWSYEIAEKKMSNLDDLTNASQSEDNHLEEGITKKCVKTVSTRHRNRIMNCRYIDYETRYDSSSSGEGAAIPRPPPLKKDGKTSTKAVQNSKPKMSISNSEIITTNEKKRIHESQNVTDTKALQNNKSKMSVSNSQIITAKERIQESQNVTRHEIVPKTCMCKFQEGILAEVLRKVEEMSQRLNYLVQINQALVNQNLDFPAGNLDVSSLPGKTVESLNKFNADLEDKEVFSKMCASFQVVGGKDIADNIRRILGKIVDNNLALSCNWIGRNGKTGFSGWKNILALILVAVRKNPLGKDATENDVAYVTKLWLRSSCDRNGGRSKRKNDRIKE